MSEVLTLGMDLGGTQARTALVRGGEIVRRLAEPTDTEGGPDAILGQFRRMAAELRAGTERAAIVGAGICTPGPLDTETGTTLHIPTLPGWEDFPVRERMAEALSLPVVVENDGTAATFGEWRYGAGQGKRHVLYVTVSTGIGGGAVVDGALLHGHRGMATHMGHFRMASDGPVCACGATACFEALAAGTALAKRARAAATAPGGHLGAVAAARRVETRDVVEGARAGDPACLALIAEEAALLGQGFTGLMHLFSPELLIMGGGVSNAFDLLEDGIRAVVRRDAMPPFREVPIVRARLGDNAGLIGAATLALEKGNG